MRHTITILVVTIIVFFNSKCFCSDTVTDGHSNSELSEKLHDQPHHNHHFEVFVGADDPLKRDNNMYLMLGFDYEYLIGAFDDHFGIAFYGELIFAHVTEMMIGLPMIYHFDTHFRMWVAPSVVFQNIFHEEVEEHAHSIQTNYKSPEHSFLAHASKIVPENTHRLFFRVGAAYDLHLKNFTISPILNADLIGKDIFLIYGIGFGLGF